MLPAILSLPQLPSSHVNQLEVHKFKSCGRAFPMTSFSFGHCKVRGVISKNFHTNNRYGTRNSLKPVTRECIKSNHESNTDDDAITFERRNQEDEEEDDEEESPWEGAVIYKRNPSQLHLEYCTTLERLGLYDFSSDLSVSRAAEMGLRTTKAVKDYPDGTPVQISIDITKRANKNVRLDGIIKTVISGVCYRCYEEIAESEFCDFTLLLTSEPVEEEEPDTIDMEQMFEEDKVKAKSFDREDQEDSSIDLDDQLYFPPGDKEIDISKYIRDLVYLRKPFYAVCNPGCRGICFTCGNNLNTSSCDCEGGGVGIGKGSGTPLANLLRQFKEKRP